MKGLRASYPSRQREEEGEGNHRLSTRRLSFAGALIVVASMGCSKSRVEAQIPEDAAPPPACKASLQLVPVPADWRTYVIAARGDSIETTRGNVLGETVFISDVGIGDFTVRSTFGKNPVPKGPLVVRQQGCTGAEISADPYCVDERVRSRKSELAG